MSTAALGELLKRLRRAAVDGVVPEREFVQGVRVLAVDDAAQGRLRDELARLGLRVGNLHVHADIDSHFSEKVVGGNEKSVNPRVALARGLLARYADAEGGVTSRVVEGVVRLSGLSVREAAELLSGASVRPDTDGAVEGNPEPSGTSGVPEGPLKGVSSATAGKGPAPATRLPSNTNEVSRAAVATTADWDRARQLAKEPPSQAWLAEYALAAVGRRSLTELIGQPACEAALRVARDREPADHSVLAALEILRRVWDKVAEAGLRPEDFLDRPTDAFGDATPRSCLAARPLVHAESRLAVRNALRKFAVAAEPPAEPVQEVESLEETPGAGHTEEAQPSGTDERPETAIREVSSADTDATAAEPERAPVHTESPWAGPSARIGARETDAARGLQFTADWAKATALVRPPFGGEVAWLAEYALLAVGRLQLGALLGSSAADAVVRAARRRGMLNRHAIKALEVLEGVFDTVKELGLRPEHFFERPADALLGMTPRTYLTEQPLMRNESRLAVRDALREFVDAQAERNEPASVTDEASAPQEPRTDTEEPAAQPSTDADRMLAEVHTQHEAEIARLAREHEHRLTEERSVAAEHLAAVRAEAEQQLAALEEQLLDRADRTMERREQHVRRQAEGVLARLKEEHHEAYQALLRRTERAEETARQADGAEERIHTLEQRLREYREGAEAHIGDLESRLSEVQSAADERERAAASAREEYREGARLRVAEVEARLREAEAAVAQRDLFVEAARRRAEEAEQEAARRIAQSEHDAWLRITDLQTQLGEMQTRLSEVQAQLAAAQEAADRGRGSLRDRWRRS
ncbi:hypothetical protein [Streptomyces sp. NPDC059787]|uniref:hypothetical protein n=1 Tax=Streptomyces sp. NPDC059787 TaxID=3346947 RepID=UPI00365A48B8